MAFLRNLARALAQIEIYVVGLAVFGSMVLTDLLPWAVLTLILFWGLRWLAWGHPSVRTPVDFPLLILTLLVPINYWISPLPEKSLPQLLRLLTGIGLFYAIVNGVSVQRLGRGRWFQGAIGLIFAGMVGLAFFSLFSVEWATYKLPFIPQTFYSLTSIWVGDTIHPNVLGGILVLLMPIPLGVLLFADKGLNFWKRGGLIIGLLVVVGFLLLSQSRGAILALGGAMAILFLLRWKWGWIGVAAGVLISAGVVWRVGIAQVLDILLVGATISGADGRVQIWQRALYMIQDFPFTGVGMGLYGDVAEALYPFPGVDPRFMPHAHQLFLQVAVDMGLPGGMAWLAIFVQSILVAWRVYKMARQEKNAWMTGLAAGLLASQVALTLHGLIDAVTWGMVRPAPLVWGLWGLIFAAHLDLSGRVEKPILPPNEYSPSVGSSEKKG